MHEQADQQPQTEPRDVRRPSDRVYDLAEPGMSGARGTFARIARMLSDPRNIAPLTRWIDRRRFHGFGARSVLLRPAMVDGACSIAIGSRCYIGRYARLAAFRPAPGEVRIAIGEGTLISPFVHIGAAECVRIGEHVTIGAFTWITDHDHDIADPTGHVRRHARIVAAPTTIGPRAYLGERVAVLRGVTVGEGAIVGTNSVVTKDVPPFTIVAGAPARVIKRYDRASGAWVRA